MTTGTLKRRLHLTTPLMHGTDVKMLQARLQRHGFLKDGTDGEYGILTAQAVHRAKFWLGYTTPDQSAGALLLDYLNGREPTAAMKRRAAARKRARKAIPMRVRALQNLIRHLGEKEHPAGSNRVPWASEWYGITGPWCAMAATRVYVDAGSKAFVRGKRYAYVPFIVADARAGRNNLTVTNHPEPGDLVCYDWEHNGVADHVGLFESWIAGAEGIEFHAIEGNTAVGNDSNGGEVMRRNRRRSLVQAFVHVGR